MKNLETDRLVLRRFKNDDARTMFNNRASDSRCTEFLSWEAHKEASETQKIINWWVSRYEEDEFCNWAFELKSNNQIIGNSETVRFKV